MFKARALSTSMFLFMLLKHGGLYRSFDSHLDQFNFYIILNQFNKFDYN